MAGSRFIENPIRGLIFLPPRIPALGWQSHRDPPKAKPFERVVKAPHTWGISCNGWPEVQLHGGLASAGKGMGRVG